MTNRFRNSLPRCTAMTAQGKSCAMVAARDGLCRYNQPALAWKRIKITELRPVDIGLPDALQSQSGRRRTGRPEMTEYYPRTRVGTGTHSILMVIVRIYPTSGTAIEVFLRLFVTVSFLKVRVRAYACAQERAIRSLPSASRTAPRLRQ